MSEEKHIVKKLASSKPDEIYYTSVGKIEVIQVIEKYEGFKDEYGYEDPNGDTVEFYDFIRQKNGKINTRSVIAEKFQHDFNGKSPNINVGFSDRHAHIIKRVFSDHG